jgi:hypothetical protein
MKNNIGTSALQKVVVETNEKKKSKPVNELANKDILKDLET